MRDARNDRPSAPGYTSGSSSAPSNGANAGTTICVSSSGSSRSSGRNRSWRRARPWRHRRRASTGRFTGRCCGRTPLRPRSHPRRRLLRRPRCRTNCARHGSSLPGCADRAERHPRQCSRRPGNAGLRHRRWHDPGRPLLTLRNAARSMDYRANRHPSYAPVNSHGRPAPTVTVERTGEGAALAQFTFTASPRVGPISRFMTRSAMPSRSVGSRFRMTRVEPDSLASTGNPAAG